MVLKRNHSGSRRAPREVNRAVEWVQSVSNERALNNLVVLGILPNKVTTGWCLVVGENFPMPHSNELIVFEDHFIRGFVSQFILFSMG